MKTTLFIVLLQILSVALFANGNQKSTDRGSSTTKELTGIDRVAYELNVSTEELKKALGSPTQGEPNFKDAAEKLGISGVKLEELMRKYEMGKEQLNI